MSGRVAWTALAVVAGALALRAVLLWVEALAYGGPVLYGEGAVAHAGEILARGGDPYGPEPPGGFVAANYPPLAFAVAALGSAFGPFAGLRIASIVATLAVAAAVAWRARADRLVAAALALSFLALVPVETWGPAAKPDPIAVALVAAAVVLAGSDPRRAALAGAAAAFAVFAKPTAIVPLAAVAIWLVARDRRTVARVALAAAVGGAVALAVTLVRFDVAGLVEHVVRRNALPLTGGQLVSILVAGAGMVGVFAVAGAFTTDGRMRAYLVGAALVVVLAAREGSTINYLLDLAAASTLALATEARRARILLPVVLGAQLVLAALLFHPLDASATVGAWGDPTRVVLASDLVKTAPHLAEDSGVLVANGIEPVVDDLFLWSRLVEAGAVADDVTERARNGEFATVIAEVPLDALDGAPAYERQRWSPALAAAVVGAYRLDLGLPHHYRYVPRRGVAEMP